MVSARKILGLPEDANLDEVRSAFRRLAKLIHPDHNPSEAATEMMRIVNLAFDEATGNAPSPPPKRRESTQPRYYNWAKCPDCETELTFGKWEGLTAQEVLETDPTYVAWVLANFREGSKWHELFVVAVNHLEALVHPPWTPEERERINGKLANWINQQKRRQQA